MIKCVGKMDLNEIISYVLILKKYAMHDLFTNNINFDFARCKMGTSNNNEISTFIFVFFLKPPKHEKEKLFPPKQIKSYLSSLYMCGNAQKKRNEKYEIW